MQKSKIKLLSLLLFIALCQPVFTQYIPYNQKGKWGFSDTKGRIVVPCVYDAVDFYSEGFAKAKKSGKTGYINKKGTVALPFQYDDCIRIYEGHDGMLSNGFNYNPEIHLNDYFNLHDKTNNLIIVSQNKKYGVISLSEGKTKTVIPMHYSKIQFDPGKKTFHCQLDGATEYFSINGARLTKEEVNKIRDMRGAGPILGMPWRPEILSKNGKKGVIQKTDKGWSAPPDTLLSVAYDDIIIERLDDTATPNCDVFAVLTGGGWGMAGIKNNILLPAEYDKINFDLSKNSWNPGVYKRIFVARKGFEWGVIGKKDDSSSELKTLLPFEYNAISKMYHSYFLVKKNNMFQVFSTSTHSLISSKNYPSIAPYEYESVNGFHIFKVTNALNQTVYLGENGVEFFKD